jgi:hypothetical protein
VKVLKEATEDKISFKPEENQLSEEVAVSAS